MVELTVEIFQRSIRVRSSRVRAPITHIPLHVIILTHRGPYDGAHVAHTSRDGALTDMR
jgi:hypothetical protein